MDLCQITAVAIMVHTSFVFFLCAATPLTHAGTKGTHILPIHPVAAINKRNEALWKNSGQMKADMFSAPTQKAQLLITKCLCNCLVGTERWNDLLVLGSACPKALFTATQVPQESMPSMFTPCLYYHSKEEIRILWGLRTLD